MSYQFIVISVSDERRRALEAQFREIKVTVPIRFLEPSLISNSQDYLPTGLSTYKLKILCCSRDHLRAIEYAAFPDSPEFTVIFEDDVAMHKTQFLHSLEEIIANWETLVAPNKMASLGWIPCNNYKAYINYDSAGSLKCILGSKLINNIYFPGLQSYIVRKRDVAPLIKDIIHPTYEKLKEHLTSLNIRDLKCFDFTTIDDYLNRMLGQSAVFPPMAIERDVPSLIGNSNETNHWGVFFKDYECLKNDYITFSN
jgi:hypothetical protein